MREIDNACMECDTCIECGRKEITEFIYCDYCGIDCVGAYFEVYNAELCESCARENLSRSLRAEFIHQGFDPKSIKLPFEDEFAEAIENLMEDCLQIVWEETDYDVIDYDTLVEQEIEQYGNSCGWGWASDF